ncbi:MAG: cupin domain-containing protein [Alphaproteobacteria bacterium]
MSDPKPGGPLFRPFREGYRWDEVAHMPYKEDGSVPFKAISRQVLFEDANLSCQWRYFEMQPGGYSTLERHEHMHAVMILRGHGHCLLGTELRSVGPFDLVTIPSWTLHQFRATKDEPMGFLCMVNSERDKPQLPNEDEIATLRRDPAIAAFLDG